MTFRDYLMNLEKIRKLQVHTPQGYSGDLIKEARYSFNYLAKDREKELSLALPLRAESYSSGGLFSIFEMNRPEGYLLESIRNRFGKIARLDDMALLKITGHNQIGRLSYVDPDDQANPKKASIKLIDLIQSKASEELFNYLADVYFDSGISGFQPKVMIKDDDLNKKTLIEKATAITSNLIVKSAGEDYPHLAENEFLCMSVAKEAGLDVPEFWLSEDNGLIILKRFDITETNERLGLEDMCSISNTSTENKYHGSYENIALVIDLFCKSNAIESNARYFEYVALSVLLKNGDAHLKNFSLIYDYPSGHVRLSPLYDVVTTAVYKSTNPITGMNIIDRNMALSMFKSKNYPDHKRLVEFGKSACHVSKPELVIERIEEAKLKVLDLYKDRINKNFMKEMALAWDVFP